MRLVASNLEDLTHDWIKGVEKINGLTVGNLNLLGILAREKDMIMTNNVITGTDREPVITTIGNLHGRAVIKVKGESGKKPVRGKGSVNDDRAGLRFLFGRLPGIDTRRETKEGGDG